MKNWERTVSATALLVALFCLMTLGFNVTSVKAQSTDQPSQTGERVTATAKATGVVKFSAEATMFLTVYTRPSTFSMAGEKILYRYVISNQGSVPITSTALTDSKVTNFTCRPAGGPITVGALKVCNGTYTTTAGDVGKDITSWARVTGKTASGDVKPPPPITSRVKYVTPYVAAKPKLTLEMTVSPKTYSRQFNTVASFFSKAGEKFNLTFKVTNTGKRDIREGLGIYDQNRARTSDRCRPWPTKLAAGKTAECTIIKVTKPADVGKDILIEVQAVGLEVKPSGNNPSPEKITSNTVKAVIKFEKPVPPPKKHSFSLTASASPDTCRQAGEKIATSYKITNTGNVTWKKLRFVPDNNLVNKDIVDGIKCPPANAGNEAGRLAPGESVTCTGTYTTTERDIGYGVARWWVDVEAFERDSIPYMRRGAAIKVKCIKPKIVPKPRLIFSMNAIPRIYTGANQKIKLEYRLYSGGNVPITQYAFAGPVASQNIKCPPAFTQAGGGQVGGNGNPEIICTGSYTTTEDDVRKKSVTLGIRLSSLWGGDGKGAGSPVPEVKGRVQMVYIKPEKPKPAPKPSLSLAVKPSPGTFSAAGQTITYIYTIANTGNVPFKSFGLGDKLPGLRGPECPPGKSARGGALAPGASATCLGTYTTKPGDLGRDIVTNPIAFAKPAKGRDVDAPAASAVVKFAGKPSMSLTHTCNPKTYTAAGQAINCSFTVTNTGTIPIRSCQITGSRINVGCPPGVIPPGASILVQGSYSTNEGDIGKNIVMDFKLDGITQ